MPPSIADGRDGPVAAEFQDVRASIRTPFENLDGRVRVLESKVLSKNLHKGKSRPSS